MLLKMSIGVIKMIKILIACIFLFVSFFGCFSMNLVPYVYAQTDLVNKDSDKTISRNNNANDSEIPLLIKPVNAKSTDPDQENIGRDAMVMIMEITKANILYAKNKSSANLAFEEQKLKDREKQNKAMKEYNETYNKKYLTSFERYQKMRGKHAGYRGIHSDYSAYLEQFLVSNSR